MRKTILAVAAVLIALAIMQKVFAQAPTTPRWEYGIYEKSNARFRIAERVYDNSGKGLVGLYAALGGLKPLKSPDRAEDAVLQLLGQGGWELTTADADRVYFKRQLQ